jgi:hypothetical protein
MNRGVVSFIAGLGTGYLQQSKYQDEQDRLKKLDQMAQEKHDADMRELNKKAAGDTALQTAAAPQQVDQGAGGVTLPASADNRDVGQPDGPTVDNGQLQPGVRVGGTTYTDPAAASAAAAAANQPGAVRTRQIQALNGIDPERAARLEQETTTTQASQVKLDEAKQSAADRIWSRSLGAAMSAGHDGLAQLVSASQTGPMAGKQIKAVPSVDGKTVTYNVVNEDGTMRPTNLTFSNDLQGVTQAGYLLDKTITPEHRAEFAQKEAKTQAEIQELGAKGKYWNSFADQKDALIANGGAAPKRADHFDEKEWDKGAAIDKELVAIPDPIGGDKPTQSGDLRTRRMQLYNAARSAGTLSPAEAAEAADTAIVNVKNIAAQRVADAKAADKKSTLTMDQSIKQVLKEVDARAKIAKAAPAAEPGSAPGVKIAPADQAARDKDAVGALNAELVKYQTQLQTLGPNGDPATVQRVQADIAGVTKELARYKARPAAAGVAAPATVKPPAAAVASAGVPAPAQVPAQPAGPGPDLDAARAALVQAKANLLTYSPRKMAQDPQGFASAKTALAQAQQRAAAAEAAWRSSLGTVPASTVRPGLHL